MRRKGKTGVFLKDMGQSLAMYWVLIQARTASHFKMHHHLLLSCCSL